MSDRCIAVSKYSGLQCTNPAQAGSRYCFTHNKAMQRRVGDSLPGPYRAGRYSPYLPKDLLPRYMEARQDPELLALRDDIALLETRVGSLLENIKTGFPQDGFKKAQEHVLALDMAIVNDDRPEQRYQIEELKTLFALGAQMMENWNEIYTVVGQRQRLAESERRRLVEMQQVITVEKTMSLLTAITESIRRHVTDVSILAAIAEDLRHLVPDGSRGSSRSDQDEGRSEVLDVVPG